MRNILIILVIILFSTGCNIGGQGEEVRPLFIGNDKVIDQTKADEAKKLVLSMEEVIAVAGVNSKDKKNIYVATKVKQFDRFFLDRIRKKAQDKIKKRFDQVNVHVSTDKKVFLELEELEKLINKNKIDEKNIKKRIKKIEDYMKG